MTTGKKILMTNHFDICLIRVLLSILVYFYVTTKYDHNMKFGWHQLQNQINLL